jgi:excisionase family DNA binding protein
MSSRDLREPLLTTREVAEWLGVSSHTVLDWAEDGRLPSRKLGSARRYVPSEIQAWLDAKAQGTGEAA